MREQGRSHSRIHIHKSYSIKMELRRNTKNKLLGDDGESPVNLRYV